MYGKPTSMGKGMKAPKGKGGKGLVTGPGNQLKAVTGKK